MTSQLNLNALRVFVQVAESGSFTAAAQVLDLPTSNVSRYVAQLERQIGQRLLERSSRQLRLTSVGQGLFDTVQPWWGALKQAEQDLLDAQAARIDADATLQVAYYSLLQAMGLLTVENLKLGIPTYDPAAYYNAVKDAPYTSTQGKSLDRVLRAIGQN